MEKYIKPVQSLSHISPVGKLPRRDLSGQISKGDKQSSSLKFLRKEQLFTSRAVELEPPCHALVEEKIECWSSQRTSWVNLGVHVLGGVLFLILPFIIFRYVLQIDLSCYESDKDSSSEATLSDCGAEIWSHRFIKLVSSLHSVGAIVLLNGLMKPPQTPGFDLPNTIRIVIVISNVFYVMTESIVAKMLYFGGYMFIQIIYQRWSHPTDYHRVGVELLLLSALKYFGSIEVMKYLGPHIRKDLIWGLKASFLVPVIISITQGLTLLWVSKNSARFVCTENNLDYIIYLTKWEAGFFNTLKVTTLFDVMQAEGSELTLLMTALLEILGRNQFWYAMFHRVRNLIRGDRKRKHSKFSFLRKVFLWSELDTDHFPLIIFTIVNIFKSPLLIYDETKYHAADKQLNLKSNSLMQRSFSEILILWGFIFLVDAVVFLVHLLLGRKRRVYKLRQFFLRSSKLSFFFSPVTFGTLLTMIFSTTDFLKQFQNSHYSGFNPSAELIASDVY